MTTLLPDNLVKFLGTLPVGKIQNTTELAGELFSVWDALPGSRDDGMRGEKLLGRMEAVFWNPPLLCFVIERHGGTVNGSSRAELQHWEINTAEFRARVVKHGKRQLDPMAKRLNVAPIAENVASALMKGQGSLFYTQKSDGSFHLNIDKIIPNDSSAQTIAARRKRLRKELDKILLPQGWQNIRPNVYSSQNASG